MRAEAAGDPVSGGNNLRSDADSEIACIARRGARLRAETLAGPARSSGDRRNPLSQAQGRAWCEVAVTTGLLAPPISRMKISLGSHHAASGNLSASFIHAA